MIAHQLRLASLACLVLPLCTPAAERLTSRPRFAVPQVKALPVGEEVRTGTGQRRRVVLVDGSILHVNQHTTVKVVAARRLKLERGEVLVEAVSKKEPFVIDTVKRTVAALGTTFAVRVEDAGTNVIVARGKVKVTEGERQRELNAGQMLRPNGDKPEPSPNAAFLFDWARDLMIAAETPLVPASKHQGGSLTVVDPNGQEARLHLRKYHVAVHIEDGFARTTIDQTYFNHTPGRLEGVFHFPLPPDASLSRLAMYVEGTRMEGGMVERDYGRNVYESIVTKQQDPALLEWVDGTTFRMRVFPLEPRQEKRIVLSYSQRLGAYSGQEMYRFPAGHSLERVRDWSLHVRIRNGAKLPWHCASHPLKESRQGDLILTGSEKNAQLDRDLVVMFGDWQSGPQPRFSTVEHEGQRYLMVRYRPQLEQQGPQGGQQRDRIILFESSGDRDPLLARAQVEIVRGLLTDAPSNNRFLLMTVGTRTRLFRKDWSSATEEKVQEALRFLENSHLIGALDLGKALDEALPLAKGALRPQVIHIGSGIATMGEQRTDALVKHLPDDVQYVGIGVGRRWNRVLMKAAAEKTGGLFTQINPDESISWRSFELSTLLTAPRLLDVSVRDDSGKNRFLTFGSVVNQGEEVCALARLTTPDLPEKVTIRGQWAGQPIEYPVNVENVTKEAGYLPRTWAKLEIDRLLAEDAVKHKDEIVKLSKSMYVMTPFTSLLVLENEAMYQQYKVEKGRKDHWASYDCPAKIDVVCEDEDGNRLDPMKLSKSTLKQVLATLPSRTQEGRGRGVTNATDFSGLSFSPALGSTVSSSAETAIPSLFFGRSLREETPSGRSDLYLPQQGQREPERVGQIVITGNDVTKSNIRLERLKALTARGAVSSDELRLISPSPVSETAPDPFKAHIVDSENYRQIKDGWNRQMMFDLPPHMTNERIQGGIDGGGSKTSASGLAQRPRFSNDDRLFFDLVAHAPGMSNSMADILAVLEAEATLSPASKPGKIDAAARKLLDGARGNGWRRLQLEGVAVTFDGTGRYVYERTIFLGIRERVVCDGETLWHLYPDLHIGAKRSVSRFHRLSFNRLVPWALPKAEDLARGADLVRIDERTIAVVPHGVEGAKEARGKPVSYSRLHLVFDENGQLAEQQVVEMPAKKIVGRVVLGKKGDIRILDEKSKELAKIEGSFSEVLAVGVKADVKNLVVLPLPYRTREHIIQTRKLEKTQNADLSFEDATALFAADFAAGSSENLVNVFKQAFHGREQRQLGLYVLLAAAGQNLDAQSLDVLAEHRDEPLAQYLALHTSPVLRKHASQWAVGSVQWGEGFLRHLAVTHALLQRWSSARVLEGNFRQRQEAIASALDYAEKNRNSHFGFALLGLMQDRAAEAENNRKDAKDVRQALARLWTHFEKTPGLETAAKYESARALWKIGKAEAARKAFRALFAEARKNDGLLQIDDDFHRALLGDGKTADEWNALLRQTAKDLIAKKQRPAVLLLAKQCWSLDDQPLAQDLLALALDGIEERKERLALTVAVVELLRENGKLVEAERLLQPLLDDAASTNRADLWRLATQLAEGRELPTRQLECLERALDAEYRDRPEVMQLETIDREYARLLAHYQNLTEAMLTLKVTPPADFLTKVVRTADRWRSLSRNGTQACDTAARILRQLGERELAWDYLTTPVGLKPGSSEPWLGLAGALRRQGDLKLADEAFASAFAAEPTSAQILWDRAQNLRQSGNVIEARKLLRQLADSTWQPRFQALVSQARYQLEQR